MSKIVHLKLTSGEEILGKEIEPVQHGYRLESVRVLVMQPTPDGRMGVALMPWMVGNTDGKVDVPAMHVIGTPVDGPSKEIEDTYLQQTSGIAFAAANDSIKV